MMDDGQSSNVGAPAASQASGPPAPRPISPAISLQLLIIGIILAALAGLGAANSVLVMLSEPEEITHEDPQLRAAAERGRDLARMTGSPVVLLMYLVMLGGGAALIKRQLWGLALAGSIIALLPCSIVICLGLPVGVWSLVVLNLPGVRASFR